MDRFRKDWSRVKEQVRGLDARVILVELLAIVGIAVLFGGIVVARYPDVVNAFQSVDTFDAFMERHRESSVPLYIAIQALQVIVAVIPGQIVQIAGGYIYGFWYAALWSLIGLGIGSIAAFYMARFIGQKPIKRIYGEEMVNKYTTLLSSRNTFAVMLFLYILPGFPKDILAFFAGLSDMRFSRFLPMATLARFPAMAISMLIGSTLGVGSYSATAALVIACLVFAGICFVFREKLLRASDRYFGFHMDPTAEGPPREEQEH